MILNIIVDECWKCKNDFLVSYLADDSMPVGPSYFSDKQIELAIENGVKIDLVHSKTMDTDYNACICPHCGAFLGEFFYHDFVYIEGDVQYKLNEFDVVIEKIVNNEIVLRENNGYDPEKERIKLENEIKELEKNKTRLKRVQDYRDFNCVRVKFDNGKNYPYNCPFEVKIGDTVYVEGKLQGVKGKVIKIEGKWRAFKSMQEVIKVENL